MQRRAQHVAETEFDLSKIEKNLTVLRSQIAKQDALIDSLFSDNVDFYKERQSSASQVLNALRDDWQYVWAQNKKTPACFLPVDSATGTALWPLNRFCVAGHQDHPAVVSVPLVVRQYPSDDKWYTRSSLSVIDKPSSTLVACLNVLESKHKLVYPKGWTADCTWKRLTRRCRLLGEILSR